LPLKSSVRPRAPAPRPYHPTALATWMRPRSSKQPRRQSRSADHNDIVISSCLPPAFSCDWRVSASVSLPSVARPSSAALDPQLCVPASRRGCPFRRGVLLTYFTGGGGVRGGGKQRAGGGRG